MSEKDGNKASILSTLSEIENSGFDVLLQPLFVQLKVPYPCPIPCCPMAQPVLVLGMFSAMLSVAQISDSNAGKFRRAEGQTTSQHQS